MARWFVDRLLQTGFPSVSLRRLLPEAHFLGGSDWEVTGCTDDHRRLEPGQVFVATRDIIRGYDGHVFVREALERGAAGVVVEQPCAEAGRLQAVVPDATAAHARICHALAGEPARQLAAVGVTGSFGKTVTAVLVHSILAAAGYPCGLLGSLGFCDGTVTRAVGAGFELGLAGACLRTDSTAGSIFGRRDVGPGGGYAPRAAAVAALLGEMVEKGCRAGVLEVSLDAISQRAFYGVEFQAAVATDVAAPTGFPADVLIQQRRAMAKLFHQVVPGGVAVVNADDSNAEILGGVNLGARRVAFALAPTHRSQSLVDISGELLRLDASGTRMLIRGFASELEVHLPLIGPRAAQCALAAAALAWALKVDPKAVVAGLESVRVVAGNLEMVALGQDFDVRIDYACTPAALGEALTALRAIAAGRLHCVMSADGGDEVEDRRRLAEIAEFGADRIILTTGNPRTEDAGQVLEDVLAGFRRPGRIRVEPDRRTAIEVALADARAGDVVLIAGKGRQTYQIFDDYVVPFDDTNVARQWLQARHPIATRRPA
jgi:UDP-N-acetylmuramoyl-L-alanyl-D-glutamate--2,6-diaminopimelate ligase